MEFNSILFPGPPQNITFITKMNYKRIYIPRDKLQPDSREESKHVDKKIGQMPTSGSGSSWSCGLSSSTDSKKKKIKDEQKKLLISKVVHAKTSKSIPCVFIP